MVLLDWQNTQKQKSKCLWFSQKTSSVFSVLWPGTTQQQTNEVLLIRGDSVHEDKWRGEYETVVIDEIQDFPGSADEFMEIVLGHWDSWEDDAIVVDKLNNIYAHPDKVHKIDFKGEYMFIGQMAILLKNLKVGLSFLKHDEYRWFS